MSKPDEFSESVSQDQLAAFVRRIEALEDEATAIGRDKSEVYKEAKGQGFNVKVLRKIIADRRKDSYERDEFQAIYDLYWSALHGVARAHVETIEQFPAGSLPSGGTSAPSTDVLAKEAVPSASFAPLSPQPYEAGLPEATASGDTNAPHEAAIAEAGFVTGPASASSSEPLKLSHTDPLRSGAATRKDAGAAAPVHYNPDTHFLNSRNLERLHGCQNPEQCGSSQPRAKLCFSCSVKHDGPTHQITENRGALH